MKKILASLILVALLALPAQAQVTVQTTRTTTTTTYIQQPQLVTLMPTVAFFQPPPVLVQQPPILVQQAPVLAQQQMLFAPAPLFLSSSFARVMGPVESFHRDRAAELRARRPLILSPLATMHERKAARAAALGI